MSIESGTSKGCVGHLKFLEVANKIPSLCLAGLNYVIWEKGEIIKYMW